VESYRRLSVGLLCGLERLGITDLAADQIEQGQLDGPVCFEVPSNYEITVGGRKLVGSAQMRALGTVLQHGTLPLQGDISRICILLESRPDPATVRARATTVEETLGRPVTWESAVAALSTGFAETLNLHLAPGELTDEELTWTKELCAEKYATDEWTNRV
jgi:lipoate-protein ligase A